MMVVMNVVSAAMSDATPACRAKVAATWEKLLQRIDEGIKPADVIAALDGGDIAEENQMDEDEVKPGEVLQPLVQLRNAGV